MRDEQSDLPHHFLHGAVRVVKERPFLMDGEFVRMFFPGRQWFLADPRNAVLLNRNFQPMPMNGRRFGKAILKDHANPIVLANLYRRPRAAAVISPRVNRLERRDFSFHHLRRQPEDFHRAVHLVGQVGYVGRNYRWPRHIFIMRAARSSNAVLRSVLVRRCLSLRIELRAQTENAGTERCRILKEFSSCTAHLCLQTSVAKFGDSAECEPSSVIAPPLR